MGYNVKKGKQRADGQRNQFRTFEDLEVYKAAREFRKKMYGVTRRLPDFEKFELAGQIRRAAVSLTNNIAEGHGRYHFADQVRFFLGGAVRCKNWSMTSTSAMTRSISGRTK